MCYFVCTKSWVSNILLFCKHWQATYCRNLGYHYNNTSSHCAAGVFVECCELWHENVIWEHGFTCSQITEQKIHGNMIYSWCTLSCHNMQRCRDVHLLWCANVLCMDVHLLSNDRLSETHVCLSCNHILHHISFLNCVAKFLMINFNSCLSEACANMIV